MMTKDPDAILDYVWDWTGWLGDGETIDTATITPTGVDLVDHKVDGPTVVARLSGGQTGQPAQATCHIVTSTGQHDDRTIRLIIADR